MGIWGTDNPPASIARINLSVRVWLSSNQDLSVAAAGKGVNSAAANAGDLIVTVDIAVPKDLSTKAKKALEELAKETADFDPRAELMRKAGSFAAKGSK